MSSWTETLSPESPVINQSETFTYNVLGFRSSGGGMIEIHNMYIPLCVGPGGNAFIAKMEI